MLIFVLALAAVLAALDYYLIAAVPGWLIVHNVLALLIGGTIATAAVMQWKKMPLAYAVVTVSVGAGMIIIHLAKLYFGTCS